MIDSGRLIPTIHKFGGEFIHSGLSAIRQAHHPEFFEGLSEYGKAFYWIAYVTVFANRSTKHTVPVVCLLLFSAEVFSMAYFQDTTCLAKNPAHPASEYSPALV